MNSLIFYITRRLPAAALISTLVVFYPNIVCLCVDIARAENVLSAKIVSLTIYTAIKFAMFWALFSVLIRYNLRAGLGKPLNRRLLWNVAIAASVYAVNLAAFFLFRPYGAREDIGSVLVFQYMVTCFMCTALGHIARLYIAQRQRAVEIERLKAESLQSQNDVQAKQYKDRLLIPYRDKLLPVAARNVSFFYTSDRNTVVYLKDGHSYQYAKTLEQIARNLYPDEFFRANKQFLIRRDSVVDITVWFDSRLLVTLDIATPEHVYVSKNRAAEFKAWMMQG